MANQETEKEGENHNFNAEDKLGIPKRTILTLLKFSSIHTSRIKMVNNKNNIIIILLFTATSSSLSRDSELNNASPSYHQIQRINEKGV